MDVLLPYTLSLFYGWNIQPHLIRSDELLLKEVVQLSKRLQPIVFIVERYEARLYAISDWMRSTGDRSNISEVARAAIEDVVHTMGLNRRRRFSVEELQNLVHRVPAEALWECAEPTATRLQLRKRTLSRLPDLHELLAVRGVCVLDSIEAADFSLNHLASLNVMMMLWVMFVPVF